MRIFLTFLGCRLNQAELDLWARQFNQAGHSVVASAEQADLMVLNSCAVTQEAVRKSRKNIKQLKKRNPAARVVVSGCFVSLQDDDSNSATAEALAVDLVVHNSDKQRLVTDSCALFTDPPAPLLPPDLLPHTTSKITAIDPESQPPEITAPTTSNSQPVVTKSNGADPAAKTMQQSAAGFGQLPVSYTHLTLPTICSV